jgi:hypothetical protein
MQLGERSNVKLADFIIRQIAGQANLRSGESRTGACILHQA